MYSDETIGNLKQAYHVLGVPMDASAPAIKRAYWRLAKYWHPDRWTSDPSRQSTATARMTELNNAYSLIRHAPLRYHLATFARRKTSDTTTSESMTQHRTMPITDHLEASIRFVFGFALGLCLTFSFISVDATWLSISIVISLGCGYCAVRFGDRFWHWILERAWLFW